MWLDPRATALVGTPRPELPTLLWVALRLGVQSPPSVARLPLAASCFLPPCLHVGAWWVTEDEETVVVTMLLLLWSTMWHAEPVEALLWTPPG